MVMNTMWLSLYRASSSEEEPDEEEEEIKLQSLSHETQKKSTHFIQSLNHDETHKKTSILYNHYPWNPQKTPCLHLT